VIGRSLTVTVNVDLYFWWKSSTLHSSAIFELEWKRGCETV